MSNAGQKILDGLQAAVDGNFSSVTIDGQRWIRLEKTVFGRGCTVPAAAAPAGTARGVWGRDCIMPENLDEREAWLRDKAGDLGYVLAPAPKPAALGE